MMRPLLRKNLLFFASSPQSRTLFVRLHLCEFSSSNAPYSHWKRLDDESRNVKVSVWWDFENCGVPAGVNVSKVAPSITDAVRANGIKGPIHITAFGNVMQLSRPNQEALAFTGIHLTHIPNGGKNSADRSLLVDLMYWVSQNPPPAHLFLISGDGDFAGILHRLRMNNYNILLAIPGKAPDVLCSAATIMWQWPSLLKGENLTGKHFNHPPDGQFGSWYGNSKVPLENPFSAAEQSTSSQNVQIVEINEPSSDSKLLEGIPKSVIRRIKHILSSHPNGISISDLRAELTKRDVSLGKNIFGYKRLSRFLSSIPHVYLQNLGDGNFCVYLISSESPEPSERITAPSTAYAVKNEERVYTTTPKLHSQDKDMDKDEYMTPSMSSLQESIVEDDSKSFQFVPSQEKPIREDATRKSWGYTTTPKLHSEDKDMHKDGHRTPSMPSLHERIIEDDSKSFQSIPSQRKPIEEDVSRKSSISSEKVEDVSNVQLLESQFSPKHNDVSKTEIGSFKVKKSEKFSDDKIVRSEDASPKVIEKFTTSGDPSAGFDHTMVENKDKANCESGKSIAKKTHENQAVKEVDDHSPYSSADDDSLVDKRLDSRAETYSKRSTFFSWIGSWWPFWKSNVKVGGLTAHQNNVGSHFEDSKLTELNQTAGNLEEPKPLEPHQDVSNSGNPEDSKLSELDQTASNLEEAKPLEPHQDVSRSGKPEDSKFSEMDQTASNLEEPKTLEPHQDASHYGKPELFSRGSFWNDMESFVFTPKGSLLISQSKSRDDLAHTLQKYGPVVLKSLSENDVFQLVALLIAEKKWLEESTSQAFPFRLTHSVQKSALSGHTNGANGLRSLFLSKTSQSNLQKSFEHDGERNTQGIQQTRVSRPTTEIKYTEKSRRDILQDCRKLVTDTLKEHPEGCNIASFRQQFADRYGYNLDVKKLGYQKISYLMKNMPGVKLESTFSKKNKKSESIYMYPSAPAVCASDSETSILKTQPTNSSHEQFNSDDELSDSVANEESSWEELGPVSAKNLSQNDLISNLTLKAIELDTPKHPDYEPIVSDDDSSESEDDSSCLTQPEELRKPKHDEICSSLFQTLESFHSRKEGDHSVDARVNNILDSSKASKQGIVSKNTSGNYREKQKFQKYNFVDDPALPDNDKCFGGLLDSSKKEDSVKMQN